MNVNSLLKDFYENYEKSNRLRSEFFELNKRLAEGDPSATIDQWFKVRATFKDMRVSMDDLERAINKAKEDLPSTEPPYETPS